jgi:hypothetical protein
VRTVAVIRPVGTVRRNRWLDAIVIANIGFWSANALHEWFGRGLFLVVGVDWARFWGAARAFGADTPASAYHLPMIGFFMQPLVHYARPGSGGIRVGPAPYPPIFLKLFAVFTLPPPPLGFLLWTAVNAGLALFVARRVGRRFRSAPSWRVILFMLASFPLMMALYVGQIVVLLLVCLLQAVTEFERGRELQGGIWTGLLILKPQYAWAFLLVYLLKRRAAAIAGFALGAGGLLAASLAVGGVGGLIAYARMLVTDYPAYRGGVAIDPRGMIGWRALVTNALPHLGTGPSLLLVAFLSAATVGLLPVIWRGAWQPSSPRFVDQLTATVVITLLVAYHSQPHGATLLMVPAGLAVARPAAPPGLRTLLVGSVAAAPLLGTISALVRGDLSLVSVGITVVLVAMLGVLVHAELTETDHGRPRARQSGSPARAPGTSKAALPGTPTRLGQLLRPR